MRGGAAARCPGISAPAVHPRSPLGGPITRTPVMEPVGSARGRAETSRNHCRL